MHQTGLFLHGGIILFQDIQTVYIFLELYLYFLCDFFLLDFFVTLTDINSVGLPGGILSHQGLECSPCVSLCPSHPPAPAQVSGCLEVSAGLVGGEGQCYGSFFDYSGTRLISNPLVRNNETC